MTMTSSSGSLLGTVDDIGASKPSHRDLLRFSTDAYLLEQKGFLFLDESPQDIMRCSVVICEESRTSMPTQPQVGVPAKVLLLSCSPADKPFGAGDVRLFRLNAMADYRMRVGSKPVEVKQGDFNL